MSIGINLVVLYGHLGKDPELKHTAGGPVLKLRLATGRRWKDKEDNKHEETQWHNVTVFGKYAETLSRILTKGMGVTVRGRLETSSYEKEGQKRYSTSIIAEDVAAGSKGQSNGATRPPMFQAPTPDAVTDLPF